MPQADDSQVQMSPRTRADLMVFSGTPRQARSKSVPHWQKAHTRPATLPSLPHLPTCLFYLQAFCWGGEAARAGSAAPLLSHSTPCGEGLSCFLLRSPGGVGPLRCKDVHTGLWDCLGTCPARDRANDSERKGVGALSNKFPAPAVPGCPCRRAPAPGRRAGAARLARPAGSLPACRNKCVVLKTS